MSVSWYGNDVKKEITSALLKGVGDSLEPIKKTAKANVRVLTGGIRDSIQVVKPKVDGDEIFGMVAANSKDAIFLEVKYPFLRPALMSNENDSLKNYFENKLK